MSVDAPELPDEFVFHCGPTLYDVMIPLEAVGVQAHVDRGRDDGDIVPIDKLNYRPAIGWEKDVPGEWPNVVEFVNHVNFREKAKECVYRYWRPKMPINIWGYEIKDLPRILPLQTEMVRIGKVDGKIGTRQPAALFGKFWDGEPDLSPANKHRFLNTPQGKLAEFTRGFSIDTERGLIITSEPLYRNVTADGVDYDPANPSDPKTTKNAPAILWLLCAVTIRDEKTNTFLRHKVTEPVTGRRAGTKPHVIKRDDIFVVYWKESVGGSYVDKNTENEINRYAKGYLRDEMSKWKLTAPGTRVVAGIVPVATDGAISQVTWTVDGQGYVTTTVSRNREDPSHAMGYDERREIQFLTQLRKSYLEGLSNNDTPESGSPKKK